MTPLDNAQPSILRADRNGIATLTLNRPDARNALSRPMIDQLRAALDAVAKDRGVRVVVIAAAGAAFCSGHDLKELRANTDPKWTEDLFAACSAMMLAMTRLPQPVIARVHGVATAAGCQLVATADLAVASTAASFATPGVNIGLFCSTPMVALSRNVGRKRAMQMLLTGAPLTAAEAESAGLVNAVVAPDKLDETVYGLAETIAAKSKRVLAIGKRAFYEQIEVGMAEAYTYASAVMARNMLEADASEGISAFLAKRKPAWALD